MKPPRNGEWISTRAGWTCCVEQGNYGHPARKATWLYYVGDAKPPDLIWGKSSGMRLDEGFHSKAERIRLRLSGQKPIKRLSKKEALETPIPFRDLLISLAEIVETQRAPFGALA